VVAIDGPAGAGKSTVTRKVAERLGYIIVDTGALYRVVALAAERAQVSFDDEAGASKLAEALVADAAVQLRRGEHGAVQVMLRGQDVSLAIRAQNIGQGASKVSAHPGVRDALLELQRSQGREGGVVLEGRDIGTVVFPDAEAKFYLTASARNAAHFGRCAERGERARSPRQHPPDSAAAPGRRCHVGRQLGAVHRASGGAHRGDGEDGGAEARGGRVDACSGVRCCWR
jgi:cytidylate kinase